MEIENSDKILLKTAKTRVGFKTHMMIYVLANILLWLIWLMMYYVFTISFPWALFPTIGWGVGLGFHYFMVFKWNEKWVEKEYQRLVKEQEDKKTKN